VGPAIALVTSPAGTTSSSTFEEDVVTAGLDLLTDRERHADELAFACASALQGRGGDRVTVTTLQAALGELRHVALVVEVADLPAEVVADALSGHLTTDGPGADEQGLLVGPSYRGTAELRPVLEPLLDGRRAWNGGRAVVFPGSTTVSGTVTVGALLAATGIDRVRVLGTGADPDPGTVLVTRDFLRPRWSDGELVLHAQPAAGGTLVPFEGPNPRPCCVDHS
jgi:hypothetical protein